MNQARKPGDTRATSLRAILFDLDGTLIATRQLYVAAYARALAPYLGRKLSELEIMAHTPRAEVEFIGAMVPSWEITSCLEAFYAQYAALHADYFRGVYQGVTAMLTALRQAGYSLGVVTGKSRRAWELTAQHVNLGQLHCWIFDDDVPERKPSPAGITCALTRLQTPSAQAMYVGDGLTDVRAARAAGVLAGVVLWPKRAAERAVFAEEARALGAVIFETPDDVVEYVSTSLLTEDIA